MLAHSKLLHLIKSGAVPHRAQLSRWRAMAGDVIAKSDSHHSLSDQELRKRGLELTWKARTAPDLDDLLLEAYALVREAARRSLGMSHYAVQLMGGIALFEGGIAEMQTGEGKTLTAVLPAFLRALPGRGCHVITVNDYLAGRDAELMRPVYEMLGMTVGCVQSDSTPEERREAYSCSITYGTSKEIGFDFLRDRLQLGEAALEREQHPHLLYRPHRNPAVVQRGHYFALIDEADSVLIDEARTPLIIGLKQQPRAANVILHRWSWRTTSKLEPNLDFVYEPKRRSAYLTEAGCRRLLLLPKPSVLDTIDTERLHKHIEKALTARFGFQRDRDYVIVDDEIVIVDESTGRMMEGRTWQDGLHQAVEAKESVPITAETGMAARITVQSFFRQYEHLAGMTGTAVQARKEFNKSYRLGVSVIPTNRPCIRKSRPPRVFTTLQAKWQAVAEETERSIQQGAAVLIGTPSVEASEALGQLLSERSLEHQILNARYHELEAEIVARAGHVGRVTIATNMAGRGTDIILDEAVRERGGLQVLATEMHSSVRIDRQLVGRSARQGDPGCYQFFLSLEDELLRVLEDAKLQRLRRRARPNSQGELSRSWVRFFRRTQRRLEKTHTKQRGQLLRQEHLRTNNYVRMGLDPFLELTE